MDALRRTADRTEQTEARPGEGPDMMDVQLAYNDTDADPATGTCDTLRLLAATAHPAPGGGYTTAPITELGRRPVRLRLDGAGALIADQP